MAFRSRGFDRSKRGVAEGSDEQEVQCDRALKDMEWAGEGDDLGERNIQRSDDARIELLFSFAVEAVSVSYRLMFPTDGELRIRGGRWWWWRAKLSLGCPWVSDLEGSAASVR